jgi:hypothetical protein
LGFINLIFFCDINRKVEHCSHKLHIYKEYTDKKEKKIFLTYKEIQSGAVAKSYMRNGFLIYEEMSKYFPIYERRPSVIYDFAPF